MGLEPGDDYEQDLPCTLCFDPSFEVGLRFTPRYVRATFTGLIHCPIDGWGFNGSFILEQDPVLPCHWNYNVGNIDIQYVCHDGAGVDPESHLFQVSIALAKIAFLSDNIPCSTGFSNELEVGDCQPFVNTAHSGSGIVEWGPGIGP